MRAWFNMLEVIPEYHGIFSHLMYTVIFCLQVCHCEMFTGGASLFDLSTLLEYHNGENPPNLPECIKKIEDKSIRVLVMFLHLLE